MRSTTVTGVTLALLALWVAPAAAHAMLMPGRLAPGTSGSAELMIVHGCGAGGTMPSSDDDVVFETEAIVLEVPEGLTVTPGETAGWSVEESVGDDGLTRLRWEADTPAGGMETIRFDVDLEVGDLPEGSELWLPVVQECEQGETMTWTHPGMIEPDGTTLPAARLVVAEPTDPAAEGGLPTSVVVTIAAAVAVLAGGGVFALTGRRG